MSNVEEKQMMSTHPSTADALLYLSLKLIYEPILTKRIALGKNNISIYNSKHLVYLNKRTTGDFLD